MRKKSLKLYDLHKKSLVFLKQENDENMNMKKNPFKILVLLVFVQNVLTKFTLSLDIANIDSEKYSCQHLPLSCTIYIVY